MTVIAVLMMMMMLLLLMMMLLMMMIKRKFSWQTTKWNDSREDARKGESFQGTSLLRSFNPFNI